MTQADGQEGCFMDINCHTVSIIMPAYNAQKYIGQAIESVICQSYQDWELIIIDDCSVDGTSDIIEKYSAIDSRIVFIKNETNSGSPASARNIGMKQAHGRYIAFLDSDDWWESFKLQKQIDAMKGGNYALCHTGGFFVYDGTGNMKPFVPRCGSGQIFDELLTQYEIKTLSVVVDRLHLEKLELPFFDESIKIGEDYHLFMRLSSESDVLTLKEKLFYYRVHQSSITRTNPQMLWVGMEKFMDWLKQNNGRLYEISHNSLRFVRAKIGYYKAKFFMNKGERSSALAELRPFIFLNFKFFVLYVLALMPKFVWRLAHKISRR